MPLTVLLIGNGGREHALAWKLAQSPLVVQIYVAPGNGGTEDTDKCTNVDLSPGDFDGLLRFARDKQVNLVVPGPDQAVVDGIELVFRRAGIPCFAPSPQAAALEGSKAYAKDFMKRHGIATAAYETFTSFDDAQAYVKAVTHNVVIKADGLAAGKGVLLPTSREEAIDGLREVMLDKKFGAAGNAVVVEEFLEGQELSILAFCDGYTALPMPASQDHKRVGEGDTGLNTGGMGTYSPSPLATPELDEAIRKQVLEPTLKGCRKDGRPFVGLLFVGLMISPAGQVKVLEYNVRFGDPETQSMLALLESDLAELFLACVERRLDCVPLRMKEAAAATVVLASGGYPEKYDNGKPISIRLLPAGVNLFHAGTAKKNGQLVTAGGRVLGVTAVAGTLEQAVKLAYEGVQAISFDSMYFRRDIAKKAFDYKSKQDKVAGMTYASAGVDIEAGNSLVELIKPYVKATKRAGSDSVIGGFGGLFDLKAAGYDDPILVAGTDGVGTKLKVAQLVGKHDTIGIDLVAMSVNDLIVQGAEPLFFLDYFACSKLDVQVAADVVKGVAQGCKECNCALVGGETAEMPGLYQDGDYDLAGFAVGAVARTGLLPLPNIETGDALVALTSNGPHSNGFSLIRKIVDASNLEYSSPAPWDATRTLGGECLQPTTLYITQLLSVLRDPQLQGAIKGLSNITGGGWVENIPRMLPKGLAASIDATHYTLPPLFQWLKQVGRVDAYEMVRALNCGVGMVAVVDPARVDQVVEALNRAGPSRALPGFGQVVADDGPVRCHVTGLENWV